MRHVSRTHRVALDWLFERINLDPKIQTKYIDTKTNSQTNWQSEISHVMSGIIFLCLFNISHFSSIQQLVSVFLPRLSVGWCVRWKELMLELWEVNATEFASMMRILTCQAIQSIAWTARKHLRLVCCSAGPSAKCCASSQRFWSIQIPASFSLGNPSSNLLNSSVSHVLSSTAPLSSTPMIRPLSPRFITLMALAFSPNPSNSANLLSTRLAWSRAGNQLLPQHRKVSG